MPMIQLTRRPPRTCVTLFLVLSLLGLGGLDAAICWGADGHLDLETRLSSCCRSGAPEAPSTSPVDADEQTTLDSPREGGACDDTPLIQGTPVARPDHGAAVCLVPVAYDPPSLANPIPCEAAHPAVKGSSLRRLRSTTLLI